jgi:hypothetical protein
MGVPLRRCFAVYTNADCNARTHVHLHAHGRSHTDDAVRE